MTTKFLVFNKTLSPYPPHLALSFLQQLQCGKLGPPGLLAQPAVEVEPLVREWGTSSRAVMGLAVNQEVANRWRSSLVITCLLAQSSQLGLGVLGANVISIARSLTATEDRRQEKGAVNLEDQDMKSTTATTQLEGGLTQGFAQTYQHVTNWQGLEPGFMTSGMLELIVVSTWGWKILPLMRNVRHLFWTDPGQTTGKPTACRNGQRRTTELCLLPAIRSTTRRGANCNSTFEVMVMTTCAYPKSTSTLVKSLSIGMAITSLTKTMQTTGWLLLSDPILLWPKILILT